MRAAVFNGPNAIEIADRPDHRSRRARVSLRLRPLVLPRGLSARARSNRARVHRHRGGRRQGRAWARQGRPGGGTVHVLRRYLPELSRGRHVAMCFRRLLRESWNRRGPRRGSSGPSCRQHPRPGAGARPFARDDAFAHGALRRDVHGPPRGGERWREARRRGPSAPRTSSRRAATPRSKQSRT